jgi:DNA-binding PadR family transcriptional regulator
MIYGRYMFYGYLSLIENSYSRDSDLGDVSLAILELFAHSKVLSVYKIFSEIKSTHLQMAYKNVHKKIQRFKALQLIEEKKTEGTEHGAKYYRLTEYGLYQLFLKRISGVYFDKLKLNKHHKILDDPVDSSILGNYEHSTLFRTFLFPVVNRDTITGLKDIVAIAFFHYLHDCCKIIDEMLRRKDISGRINRYIYSWNTSPNALILDSLKEVFDLEHIDMEKAMMNKIDESTIKIFNKNFSVLIKLDFKRNKAVARLENSKKQYEYDIENRGSDIQIISHRDGRDVLLEAQFQHTRLIELLSCKIITQVGRYKSVKTDISIDI